MSKAHRSILLYSKIVANTDTITIIIITITLCSNKHGSVQTRKSTQPLLCDVCLSVHAAVILPINFRKPKTDRPPPPPTPTKWSGSTISHQRRSNQLTNKLSAATRTMRVRLKRSQKCNKNQRFVGHINKVVRFRFLYHHEMALTRYPLFLYFVELILVCVLFFLLVSSGRNPLWRKWDSCTPRLCFIVTLWAMILVGWLIPFMSRNSSYRYCNLFSNFDDFTSFHLGCIFFISKSQSRVQHSHS